MWKNNNNVQMTAEKNFQQAWELLYEQRLQEDMVAHSPAWYGLTNQALDLLVAGAKLKTNANQARCAKLYLDVVKELIIAGQSTQLRNNHQLTLLHIKAGYSDLYKKNPYLDQSQQRHILQSLISLTANTDEQRAWQAEYNNFDKARKKLTIN